jgi:AmmeMemoRadiSam system protein A
MNEKHENSISTEPKTNPADFARDVISKALDFETLPEPPDEDYYRTCASCFVSLKKHGELRGCIGTLEPAEETLGLEIIRNAQSAAFADPRFPALVPEELADLEVSVDVLSEPKTVTDMSGHNCKEHGVIVSCDYRRGVLLPDLDGVETSQQQLEIACLKAGISPDEDYSIQRFTVIRFHESSPHTQ